MLTGDLADSSLASEWPDMAAGIDSPADRLRDLIAPFVPAALRGRIFAGIDALLEEAGTAPRGFDPQLIIVETLRTTYGDTRFAGEIPKMAQAVLPRLARLSDLGRDQVAVETLRAIYGDTRFCGEIRMMAKAALIRLGKVGESYQYAGDEFGVTRACVHAHSRRMEDETGIPARRDKDADARAKSKAAATGRRLTTLPAPPTSGVLRNKRSRLFSYFPGI